MEDPRSPDANLDSTLYDLSQDDSSRFQTIKRAVWDEMIRRYTKNPHEIKALDNGMLHRLFVEITRVDFALGKNQKPETPKEVTLNIYQSLQGLPHDRQMKIINDTRKELEAVAASLNGELQDQD